jgi:hypothetical protein
MKKTQDPGMVVLFAILCLAGALLVPQTSFASDWSFQLNSTTSFDLHGEEDSVVSPRLMYNTKSLYAHLEWNVPVSPEHTDDIIEFQTEYAVPFTAATKLTFKHELYYDMAFNGFTAEFTPKLYTSLNKHVKIGVELEVDYLKNDLFTLYELEAEPTIKWYHVTGSGRVAAELEFPVCRLYSANATKNDFELETVEAIFTYDFLLNKIMRLGVELDFPYDVQKKELSFEFQVGVRWDI